MTEDNLRREREITHEIAHLTVKLHNMLKDEIARFKDFEKKSADIANCILLRQEEMNSIEEMENKMKELNGKK